jgi:hypothetical protein
MSARKERVNTPAPDKLHLTANRIILGVDVERADFPEARCRWVLKDRADIDNTQTATVVGLVRETRDNILVVVDRADGGLIGTCVLGRREILDVEDVGGGVAVSGGARTVHFVELVVEEEVGVVVFVNEPALVSVAGADVGGLRDLDWVLLVGYVGNGECVLVKVEADLLTDIFLIGALVNDALG